jgi:hypothetical protein
MPHDEQLGPIASEIVYEDDELRIWNQVIAPDQTLGRHRHDHDYVLVNVRGGGPLDVRFFDGTGGPLGDGLTLQPKRGEAFFVDKGHVETAHNQGEEYRAILVEFKR